MDFRIGSTNFLKDEFVGLNEAELMEVPQPSAPRWKHRGGTEQPLILASNLLSS